MFKKIFKIIIVITLCLAILGTLTMLIINAYVKNKASDRIISFEAATELKDIDCILVLGCAVREDGFPSFMLDDRITTGVKLYNSGASPKLLMSGDHGTKGYDEVNTMKQLAIDAGVPSFDIFMDHAGFNTYNSLYRARDIFEAKRIIIVTQDFHLSRALHIARSLGIEAYGVSASIREYSGVWLNELREILAITKDFFVTAFEPAPVCMGEVIPISGNGDITNDKEFS